jgi:PKD repeat protein
MITAQPQNQIVLLGGTAIFSVTVTGTPPFSYLWQRNGTNLSGATNGFLTLTNAQISDMGFYAVSVTNPGGMLNSSNAILNVQVIPGFISVTGDPFFENFDEMGPTGTNTPPGWYVGSGTADISTTTVTANNGTSVLGRNYNFGGTGSSDRALGSLATTSQRDMEARFVNVSGNPIASLTITYSGEQWRSSGSTAVQNSLVMQYSTDGTNFTPMGDQFNFNSPTLTTNAVVLDGNDPTNRVVGIGGAYSPSTLIPNGQRFYLRWADPDDPGTDQSMAIDDLTITFALTNPPPPAVLADFTAGPTQGVAPLTVTFTNLSSGATNYVWDFGDGNGSGSSGPTNVYVNAGTYSVTLSAFGPGGTNSILRTNYILVFSPPVLAVSPAGGDFGILLTGALAQVSFVVSNAGGSVLNGVAMDLSPPFAIASGSPFSVAPAAATNVWISFNSAVQGVFSNTLILTSDGGSSTNSLLARAIYPPLMVPAQSADGDFDFSFQSLNGFSYVLQYKDSLTDPVWQPSQTNNGNDSTIVVTNSTAASTQRFYRLVVR